MDPANNNPMAERPFGFLSPHGGHKTLVEQRPTDGLVPVTAKCFNQPPPSKLQQPVNPPQPPLIASSNGAPVFQTQQPKCGNSSAGLGHAGQQPPFFCHQGVTFQNAGGQALAGQQMLSINERLLHCSWLINQLIEQQQVLQALFSTAASPESAMAAPPSSTLPSQPQQLFEVRTSTRPEQVPTSPTESCETLRDFPLPARNRTDSGQYEQQEGGKASQIQKGRKCNNSAEPKRQQCEVEPLEAQGSLEHSVGSGTSNVNGKQFGSPALPAAVCASAATGPTQRLFCESSCDVIIGSTKHSKIVLASDRRGSDGVDDDGRFCITDSPASAMKWTTVSAVNQLDQDQQHPASCTTEAVGPEIYRCKQMLSVIPVVHPVHAPPVVNACTLFVKTNGGCQTSRNLFLSQHQHTPPQDKCVDIADDCHQQFINQRKRWLQPGEVETFVNLPPPWPPPATIIVLLQPAEPMSNQGQIHHAVHRKKHHPHHRPPRPSASLRR